MSKIRTLLLAIVAVAVVALAARAGAQGSAPASGPDPMAFLAHVKNARFLAAGDLARSEEHTSELQSRLHLVCRPLLEKKKTSTQSMPSPYPNASPGIPNPVMRT